MSKPGFSQVIRKRIRYHREEAVDVQGGAKSGFFSVMDDLGLGLQGGSLLLLLAFLVLAPSRGIGAEITYFKLLDAKGELRLDYTQYERGTSQAGEERAANATDQRVETGESLVLQTQSYIFHPNLLLMDLGGAVHFEQKDLEDEDSSRETRETVYDFSGQWYFFNRKAYPFNLYYSLAHPRKEVGFADAINVESENYGFDITFRKPLIDTPVRFLINHGRSFGENPTDIVDTTNDRVKLSVNYPLTDYGQGTLGVTSSKNFSASGRKSLPIEEIRNQIDALAMTSEFFFGEDREIELRDTLEISEETGTDIVEKVDADIDHFLVWKYDNSLVLTNSYAYAGSFTKGAKQEGHSFSLAAMKALNPRWRSNSDFRFFKGTAPEFELLDKNFTENISYKNPGTGRWATGLSYGISYGRRRQVTERVSQDVSDESHVLAGLMDVPLDKEYVLPGSVSVRSLSRTQTYVENVDYRVTVVGSETRIARMSSGSISDGDAVLVDYEYELDGSYEIRDLGRNIGVRFTLDGSYSFYGSYRTSRPKLLSGETERELIPVDSYEMGVDAEVRLSPGSQMSWKLEYGRRLSALNPHRSTTTMVGYATQLPFYSGFANLESRYHYQDNEDSTIDLKQTIHRAMISMRPGWRSSTSLDLSHRRDTGGEEIKTFSEAVLSYNWNRARFFFALTAKAILEEQGKTANRDNRLEATAKRYLW